MSGFKLKNLVFPADKRSEITLFCEDGNLLQGISAAYISENGTHQDGSMPEKLKDYEPVPFEICGNMLTFDLYLAGEGSHTIKICCKNADEELYEEFEIYSLKDDLYGVFPYKGNLHCHTADSDGRYSPQETLCIAREAGFDFTAFSEHRMFTDHSTDCAEIISKLGIALFRAEEVHSLPLWICHILSFGASSGISDMQNNASYQEKVSAAMHYFSDISEEWRSYAAQFMVINDLIKLHGGVSILCHLFWMHSGRFNVPPELTSVILKRVSFDAVEAVSSDAGNVSLANASLMEFSASGCRQVCVAGSDWHGCRGERMGEAFNIVFARKCTESDIAEAIKAGRCVAVYGEENPVVYGDFRLVKYACFLLRNFYPLRDLNAERLGVLMLSAMGGETAFLAEIDTLKIQLELQLKMLKG